MEPEEVSSDPLPQLSNVLARAQREGERLVVAPPGCERPGRFGCRLPSWGSSRFVMSLCRAVDEYDPSALDHCYTWQNQLLPSTNVPLCPYEIVGREARCRPAFA